MVPMTKLVKNMWIGRDEYSLLLYGGRVKPKWDNRWQGFDGPNACFDFCTYGWKASMGRNLLGLKKGQVKRYRLTIEEIK